MISGLREEFVDRRSAEDLMESEVEVEEEVEVEVVRRELLRTFQMHIDERCSHQEGWSVRP